MNESTAAVIYKVGPGNKQSEWHQRGLKRALAEWKQHHPDDYREIMDSVAFGWAVGFHVFHDRYQRGQYGYDTWFHFAPDNDPQFVEDEGLDDLCDPFYQTWVEQIQAVIEEDQEATLFSAKEYAAYLADQNPSWSHARAADALEITTGTFSGKLGRVKEKLEEAKETLEIASSIEPIADSDEWSSGRCSASHQVLPRVEESRLPISTPMDIENPEVSLKDQPVDELIR